MASTIVVTGGAGFIGSALVRRLAAGGEHDVVTLDRLTYAGNLDSLDPARGPRHHFVLGDVCDAPAVRALLERHRPWAVVHLAAESHVDRSITGPAEFVRTNVLGTYTMLDESLRYWTALGGDDRARFRFLHVSTDEVFGSLAPEVWAREDTPYRPSSPYAASKSAADHLVRSWHRTYGLPALTTNCSNNYGPYQFPEKLVPLMILSALERRQLPVYGDGEHERDWLHVEDHVDALLAVLQSGRVGETYCVSGDAVRRNIDVVRALCAILDDVVPLPDGSHQRLITYVEDRPGHDRRYAIDAGKLRRELGWAPAHSFEQGLRATVGWYVENRWWWERVRTGAYRLDSESEAFSGYDGERLGLPPSAAPSVMRVPGAETA